MAAVMASVFGFIVNLLSGNGIAGVVGLLETLAISIGILFVLSLPAY